MDEDLKFLRNMAHEFEEGFNSGDVDRIMRFYGDTYVDMNLRHPGWQVLWGMDGPVQEYEPRSSASVDAQNRP